MFYNLSGWYKKQRWATSAAKSFLAPLYQSSLPPLAQSVMNTQFLAVDCEMTGLNPAKDSLLSIGWVEIKGNRVELSSAQHCLVYSDTSVGQSASIHGLRDHQVAGAASAARALTSFATQARGKVLIFHHAPLDIAFLQRAATAVLGCPLYLAYVDTMLIEKRRLALQNRTDSLQLNLCRERYCLPPALQHNALADARATAELFIAQCAQISPLRTLKLKDLGLQCL